MDNFEELGDELENRFDSVMREFVIALRLQYTTLDSISHHSLFPILSLFIDLKDIIMRLFSVFDRMVYVPFAK